MADTREEFKNSFLGRISDGPGWCDDWQSLRLPLSLSGAGKATKANRLLGNRPKTIVAFGNDLERVDGQDGRGSEPGLQSGSVH